MPNIRIPNIVKHCCVAIYREGNISAKSDKDRFQQCLKIAKSRLAEYGYIVLAGERLTDDIGLTPKGRAAELRHKREGRAKSGLFDALYEKHDIDGSRAAQAKKLQEETAARIAQEKQEREEKLSSKPKGAAKKKTASRKR